MLFYISALCRFGIYVGADIDILRILRIILYIIIYLIWVSAFCGRIGNRVKIPNGAAAVSVEGAHIGFVKPATAIFFVGRSERFFDAQVRRPAWMKLRQRCIWNFYGALAAQKRLWRFWKNRRSLIFLKNLRSSKLCLLKSIFSKLQAFCLR